MDIKDDVTYYLGKHKIIAGLNYEHQMADNAYQRNGTGYYRYKSLDDFLNGGTPEVGMFDLWLWWQQQSCCPRTV